MDCPALRKTLIFSLSIDVENIKKLKKALFRVFNDLSIEDIELSDLEKYSVVRYGTPDGFCIDLIARLGETVDYKDIETEEIIIEGVKIKTATAEALYKLKKDSVRPKDQNDALFLKRKMEYLKGK